MQITVTIVLPPREVEALIRQDPMGPLEGTVPVTIAGKSVQLSVLGYAATGGTATIALGGEA